MWQQCDDSKNVTICSAAEANISYDGNDNRNFTARAEFELPDGGRFHVLLSGSNPKHENQAAEPLTAMVEDSLGLPDGFLMDINTFLFTNLCDGERRHTPEKLVSEVLKHASRLFDKLVTDNPQPPRTLVPPSALASANSNSYNAKRKRSAAVPYNEPVFESTRLATTTLMKQLSILQGMDTRRDGFTAVPIGDDLYRWSVMLYFDDVESSSMASDLANLPDHDCVELEYRFPSEYPNVPPIVRVVAPYVVGGHVAPHGGICMELLTTSGWAPVNSIDVVCIQIRTMLVQGNARIDPQKLKRVANYTFDGALRDLRNIVRIHRWNVHDNTRKRPKS